MSADRSKCLREGRVARFRVCWQASSIVKSDVCDEEKEKAEKGEGRKSMDGGKNDEKSHFEIREGCGKHMAKWEDVHRRSDSINEVGCLE